MIEDWRSLHGNHFKDVRCVVTGGAGFIGSHLAEALMQLGASLFVLDDLSGGSVANVHEAATATGRPNEVELRLVQGSILDARLLDYVMSGCRYVFHLAALGSVPQSVEQPDRYTQVNAMGTAAVLEAARKAGVQRVMFAASAAAYGDDPTVPKRESMAPLPRSPYAATKVAGEAMLAAYGSCYPLDTVSLRYFNIFGPRQNANSAYAAVIAAFAQNLMADKPPTIFGDGSQTRDFAFVQNVVHANLLAARCPDRLGGKVINIACGGSVSVLELAKMMGRLLGRPGLEPVFGPVRAGDVPHSLADIEQARQVLGYEPIVSVEEGLKATLAWYRQQQDTSPKA
ncbi:MAG: NAD-dependent epimerase/dehydratase family protein [Phycisphaeraceae bacterium]|nr:NAD-dependent epimerase/dehydratase family protein [Phycisphaeraceae bacterium]